MSRAHLIINSAAMPAGEYWVGDPCYSVPNDRWMEWLEAADYTNADTFLLADLDDKSVLGVHTKYGDGVYYDEQGRAYPVDAGLIGLTPVELVEDEPFGSHRVEFKHNFTCTYDEGTIILGNIRIDTDPSEDEEECDCGYSIYNCHCGDEDE